MTTFPRTQESDIARFFEARSVALVGASDRPGSLGTIVRENLTASGFAGPIHWVNPAHARIGGERCHARVTDIGEAVDLAIVVSPAATVPAVLEQCGAAGIVAAVVLSAGFGETGARGRELEQAAVRSARDAHVRFIGPNCLGIMRPQIGLNATFGRSMARPGHIALVSQSGAICTAMLDWAESRGVGYSCVVSAGAAADVDFGELLDYLAVDPATQAIMLYVEGLRNARRFMSALRAAARAKPVIVMKAGRHDEGRHAAVSHTGAIVGSDDVFDAALRRAGVVRVRDYANFYSIAATLHAGVRTAGPRLCVVTNGGGPGVLAADAIVDRDLVLAELGEETLATLNGTLPAAWSGANPVDVLGDATAERFGAAVDACLGDPGVDALLAILVPQAVTAPMPVAEALVRQAQHAKKPVLTCWMGASSMHESRDLFRANGIPTYETVESAVAGFAAIAAFRANQELLLELPEPVGPAAERDIEGARLLIRRALDTGRMLLDVIESKAVLAAFGISVLKSVPAHDPDEALALAEEIGFPLAMKIHSPDLTHKSDVDGVKLGITHGSDVPVAYGELVAKAGRLRPNARISGVLLEPMYRSKSGREIMLGIVNDPVFGPVVSVGLGGTTVEIIRDRSIGLPPLNRFLARRMIADTKASRYLDAFRGLPPASRGALENAIVHLSELICELPNVAELDVNPLMVDESSAVALDARIVLRHVNPVAPPYSHLAVHPYPRQFAGRLTLRDGTVVNVRPIRPEDAAIERAFVEALSERSRYLRFGYPLKAMTPQMLSRFTQIDYDREMALIATAMHGDAEQQIGVARYVTYPDGRACEFAIVVADSWQGRGIATELLRRLIDIARSRRLQRMDGFVLRENQQMLVLAKELGFEQRGQPDDSGTVLISLAL